MVFTAIAVWLLVASVPLWGYRWFLYSRLDGQERRIFKRLVAKRYESAFRFGARIFGFLVALATAVILFGYGLGYLKQGSFQIGSYKDTIKNQLYSGLDPVDRALDFLHYDQPLPIAVLTKCLLLSIVFTLVSTAFRDIYVLHRLGRKLERADTGDDQGDAI
jgi:hypothetical protein